ncbi:hypothetical protein J2129_002731 [Methanofollis sp. W23]|uniref:hypothetical protein n=1 Tax=Methanofollis sp. W23 TaxID=2817849 RepID=UPI001AE68422|nr:hypothetical protein [Methanofollis sp. W23]MBP2147218.1 hypothetical protein [Methanofollis sp. W23]
MKGKTKEIESRRRIARIAGLACAVISFSLIACAAYTGDALGYALGLAGLVLSVHEMQTYLTYGEIARLDALLPKEAPPGGDGDG